MLKKIKSLFVSNKLNDLSTDEIAELLKELQNEKKTELYSTTRMCSKYLQEFLELNMHRFKIDYKNEAEQIKSFIEGQTPEETVSHALTGVISRMAFVILLGALYEQSGDEFEIGGPDSTGTFNFDNTADVELSMKRVQKTFH